MESTPRSIGDYIVKHSPNATRVPGVPDYSLEWSIRVLNYYAIRNISQLDGELKKRSEVIEKFAVAWLKSATMTYEYDNSYVIFYLGYVLAGSTGDAEHIKDYLKRFGSFARTDTKRQRATKEILNCMAKATRKGND